MNILDQYNAWLACPAMNEELLSDLRSMDEDARNDSFYRDLAFGTGGLRGVLGAGINRMNLFTVAAWPIGVAPHTWQATACAGSSLGEKAALWAAKAIVATAYDILTLPEERERILAEFEARKDDNYVPMI